MTTLNPSTLRRLQKLKHSNAVWEGDRRSLPAKIRHQSDSSNIIPLHNREEESTPHCILWVDGSMGMVRSMDVVETNVGQEAFVRALLQAMEHPQSPAQPSRPQKILVCDRELQFYLRGVLQDLGITVEYVERLPLIDEIFSHILESFAANPPLVPDKYAATLYRQSEALWQNEPWEGLWDHQVIAIKLDRWDLDTLYAIVMGRMGLERGVIFYRSEASLVKFRQRIIAGSSEDEMEETFLHQDCLFNLFETPEANDEPFAAPRNLFFNLPSAKPQMKPIYGTLHPLEGGRPYLYDEEAIALTVALEAFNKFWEQHGKRISQKFSAISSTYSIYAPNFDNEAEEQIEVSVKTMPDLASELNQLSERAVDFDDDDSPIIHEDIFPDNSFIDMVTLPWDNVEFLRNTNIYQQIGDRSPAAIANRKGEGVPALLIQTSRPKAMELINKIKDFDGIKSLCFNPAEDFFGNQCHLGLMIMGNADIHLFGEFDKPTVNGDHFKRWKQRAKNCKGNIAVIIAMGVTGATKGKPAPRHVLAYYEIKLIDAKELGLGKLLAQPAFDIDF